MIEYAMTFGLNLLWTQHLLRKAEEKIQALEGENRDLRDQIERLEMP